jgi:hypothetical protein
MKSQPETAAEHLARLVDNGYVPGDNERQFSGVKCLVAIGGRTLAVISAATLTVNSNHQNKL